VLSTIVDQPREVEALLDAAARGGAKVLQPAKNMLFAGFSADAILSAATSAGGTVPVPAGETEWGGYSGHFTDPDGFLWKVATA
jgi:uncharacterized glyoxalase superfamily protein PhnB